MENLDLTFQLFTVLTITSTRDTYTFNFKRITVCDKRPPP